MLGKPLSIVGLLLVATSSAALVKRLLATILTFVSIGSASAADMAVKASAVKPVEFISWTGLYVGGNAGGVWESIRADDVLLPIGGFFTPIGPRGNQGFNFSNSSLAGGAHAGAQYQWQKLVVGIEGTWTGVNSGSTIISPYYPTQDNESARIKDFATVVGRLGVAASNWLFYGKAGWAGGDVDFTARSTVGGTFYSQTAWQSGWAGGAGVEYAFNKWLRAGVDYTHIDLGSATVRGVRAINPGNETYRTNAKLDAVMARLSFFWSPSLNGVTAKN